MTPGGRAAREPIRPTVERKVAAVLALAVTVLGLVGLTSIQSTRALISDADWVAHSHVVLEQLEKVLAHMGRLESDQRGYLLTGDEAYFASVRGDAEPIDRTLMGLRVLVRDNPRQRALVERLEPLALRRIAARDEVLTIRRRDGLDAAIARLRRNRGRHLMVNVRVLVDRLKRNERQLLEARSARADRRASSTLTVISAGSVVALLVLAGMSTWIRRDLRAGARAEHDLRRVSERFNLALAAAQVGTWSWDVTTDTIVWDDYIHPLFGLAPGTFAGSFADFEQLVHPDDHAELRASVARSLAGEGEYDTAYRVVWADGSEHVIAARGEVYRDASGAPARMTGVCWDVTDERRARADLRRMKEAADAANEAKSEFLTSMSHELRTPMNSIIGFSQLLLRSAKSRFDEEDRDALQTVQRNAHHLLTLINQVLDLSRVEAGKLTLTKSRLDLALLAREVVQDASPLVGTKPIRLAVEVPDEPVIVEGDPTRIRQIVTNLTANAVKYTAAGSVTVQVRSTDDVALGAVARVSVRDTGPGIAAADRAQLFQRFARLDTEATRREGGTGLGLSLSQELARMHGGRIDVQSDGQTGSDFVLTLPIGWRQLPAVACVGAGTGDGDGGGGRTILCIDDDPDVLVLYERTLREAGHRVLLASTVADGLAEATRAEPALVCVDGDLPNDDGFAVITALRAQPALACVPVIVLAGDATEARAVARGARRHVATPLQPDALLARVADVLGAEVALVLVVDRDPAVRAELRRLFELQGIGVAAAASGAEALRLVGAAQPDAVVLDPEAADAALVATLNEAPWRDVRLVVRTRRAPADLATGLLERATAVVAPADVVALVHAVTSAAEPGVEESRSASGTTEARAAS